MMIQATTALLLLLQAPAAASLPFTNNNTRNHNNNILKLHNANAMSNEKSKSTFFSEIFAKTALIALFSISSPEGAFALDSSSSSSTIENEYQFRAPTINQPQIQLTDDMQNILKERLSSSGLGLGSGGTSSATKTPFLNIPSDGQSRIVATTEDNVLLQGIVSLDDELKSSGVYSLDPDDMIVVTATVSHEDSLPSDEDPVVMGAKVKVGKVRIPMQFKLYKENILASANKKDLNWQASDIAITAKVCAPGLNKYPCSSAESKFISRGIAKRIVVPGTDGIFIWTPASLPLQRCL